MGSDGFWDNILERAWNPISWIQIILIGVTIPIWVPIVRALWLEVQEVLAPFGGVYGNKTPRPIRERTPGEDPFAKIPLKRRGTGRVIASRSTLGERALIPAKPAMDRTSGGPAHRRRPTFRSTL